MPVLDFDRPVNRFLAGFRPNEHDQRVPEIKTIQNIYTLCGVQRVRLCRFSDFDRPVNRFLAGFRINDCYDYVPDVETLKNIYTLVGF